MMVYVLELVNLYPEVDGCGYIEGVYSTRELAEKKRDEMTPELKENFGQDIYGEDAFELVIHEFEIT